MSAYGRYAADVPSQRMLERFFFLDDKDRERAATHRGDHSRLGFCVQLVTLRYVGRFLTDPLDVPDIVVDYMAAQVGVSDPSCLKRYLERRATRFEHQVEITAACGYASFGSAQEDLTGWLDDLAWTSGDGPRALFYAAVAWLRERRVLLPGVTTLTELVAEVRQGAEDRLYITLAAPVTAAQARALAGILEVAPGGRRSQLDMWRRGARNATGRGMVTALDRVAQIAGLGMGGVDISSVPARRVIELARYGLAAKAPKLARHPHQRKIATLLATVRWLEVTATDDALELFDVLMSNELIGRAAKTADKQTLRRYAGTARDAQVLKTVVQVLFEAEDWGGPRPEVLITDQGSYSDIVFAVLTLLGFDYRPVLADLPDAKLWRINPGADYGPLDRAARGKIDLETVRRHWPDILRVVASIHTREISAHDVIRVLQRDGRPTQLGEAMAAYGRIFKTLHVLTFAADHDYRRTIKGMRNLQEGRHDLARHIFHGRRGELHRAYHAGMEDTLGALGLALNCVTLWNTVYIDRILTQLRAQGHPVADADAARLSAYQRRHINVHGHYIVALPDLAGTHRPLRDPNRPDTDDEPTTG